MKVTKERILNISIELIAQYGYTNFSLGLLAEQLQVSKGVITYHFPQKEQILTSLVSNFYQKAAEYMAEHMVIDSSAVEALKTYITSNLNFISQNTVGTLAVAQIVKNCRDKKGGLIYDNGDDNILKPLIDIFDYGQKEEKCFRLFDNTTMALLVRSAIDNVGNRIALGEINADISINEVAKAFVAATK